MSGTKGRSGGRNRKTAEEHILRNTYRPDRHGQKKPVLLFPGKEDTHCPSRPEDITSDLETLMAMTGEQFSRWALAEYLDWTIGDRLLLRCAGELLDRIIALRGIVAAEGLMVKTRRGQVLHPAARAERMTVGMLTSVLAKLNLR